MATRVGSANWEDSFSVGPARLHVRRSGNVLAWRLSGSPGATSQPERAELVYLFWVRVWLRRGRVAAAWDFLFPPRFGPPGPLSGGTGWGGPVNGVAYVDRL
jgi:hypothetical protein